MKASCSIDICPLFPNVMALAGTRKLGSMPSSLERLAFSSGSGPGSTPRAPFSSHWDRMLLSLICFTLCSAMRVVSASCGSNCERAESLPVAPVKASCPIHTENVRDCMPEVYEVVDCECMSGQQLC